MQNPLNNPLRHYAMLVKRWAWVIALGIVICGGVSYIISLLIPRVYQASAFAVLNLGSTNTSAYDNTSASLAALPTYTYLLTSSAVLKPVVSEHRGLTLDQLTSMISVKPQTSTQIIELDVESTDPRQAAQLANDVSLSFAHYANTQFSSGIQIVPADVPTSPVKPRPLLNAGIGALVGLGLAIALMVVFEWIDDRPTSPEEVQENLGLDPLAIIPQLSRNERIKGAEEIPALAEGCRILCANLNATQLIKPFKLVMVTSALAGEGKSTIAANVAFFLAKTGKRVLLVDANLRHPVLDQHFQLDNHQGLSGAFMEMWLQTEVELDGQPTEVPTLQVLTAGVPPSNSAELLQSPLAHQLFDRFKASDFDYVIFDTPPLLPVADAQILASYIPITVLVIDASKTPRKVLLRAKRILDKTRTTIIGVALNKSRWSDYSDIRQYLSDTWQPKTDIDMTMPPPGSRPVDGMKIADRPTKIDPNITVAIAHRENDRGKKP